MSHILTKEPEWSAASDHHSDLGKVYREHVDYVWRALGHLGVKPADVADVAHEVFLIVRKRLPTFEGRSSLRTWIYGICMRVVSDYRSRAFRRREIAHEQVPDSAEDAPQQDVAERRQLRERLNALLSALPDEQRDVFVLYEIEELAMKEVAEALDCPIQTAYSRLHAARASLKAKLQAEGVSL